ncbi:putative hydrolase of the HAD superfamily [Kribbella voronezhensis]|uniref:Putative hydrolase of the HAD superfamily n=1 Tax=Kribbella voronezhensis TaxID=2512212 RepID=A0A4R7SV64_9ACTN|nr:HAD-IA family hydrolase [Kribbella voronezhensis]TDU82466.1 putative hydrolase of the HAD superfamily [Kribbella voronezhensis]
MPTTAIDTVLFDADGVIQRPTIDWRATLATFIRPDQSAEEFILDLMTSEQPSLRGEGDFREAVAEVLARWESTTSVDDAMQPWHWFEADPVVVDLIQQLRTAGVGCHLATNQQAYRRTIMQDERHYGDWFDQTFYSCDLGVAKPEPAYFHAILAKVGKQGSAVLFIDDNEGNVKGALSAGLHAEHYDLANGTDALRELLSRYGLPTSA